MNHSKNFEAELQYWEQWCRTILVFLGDTPRLPKATRHLATAVSTATARGDLGDLRTIAKGLGEMALDLGPESRERLDAVLDSRFGRDLSHVSGHAELAAHKALKKGRIDTDGEFRLVRSYLAAALGDPSLTQHLERIDVLVTNYEPEQVRPVTPLSNRAGSRS